MDKEIEPPHDEITGESVSEGVTEKHQAEDLLKIGEECAAHLEEPYLSIDHGDMLYDENGLPE